ncbi:unnamed protein product [Cladocopium goreaui]|uniref:Uncharacterized protein n=1 Tax=Cladocopium goreaui TaxID=2562237 RepID=A0A9P1BW47_9DINO|nr:unnamed protein product [Cladocopium goreaui]
MREATLQAIDSIETSQADALRVEFEALREAEQQTSALSALEEQQQRQVVLAEERNRQQEIQAQLHQNQLEVQRLQSLKTSLEAEVDENSRLVVATEKQEQLLQETVWRSTRSCEELERKLQQLKEETVRHGGLRELEAEVKMAQENVALELAEAKAPQWLQSCQALVRSEEQQHAARCWQRCREEEAATTQLWEERIHRSEMEAKESASQIPQKYLEILQGVQREAEKESLTSRQLTTSLRAKLQETQSQLARLEAVEAGGHAGSQAAELRQRREEELDCFAHVQQLKEEVSNLQLKGQQQADDIKTMQLEEQSSDEVQAVQALQEELHHFQAEAASQFGLPLNIRFSSLQEALAAGEEAAARLHFSTKLSESVLAGAPAQESKGDRSNQDEKLQEMKAEVHTLRFERERLVELGNDLRAELRDEISQKSERNSLIIPQRKVSLEAAVRALVAENRRLQGELLEAGRSPAVPADPMTSVIGAQVELPSSSSLRPASRGSRLADRSTSQAGQGMRTHQTEMTEASGRDALMLQGVAAPCGASSTLPVSAPGYLRQPLTEDLRPPRSATDRGTESQRKALERLRAAQAKHDEVAAAAAEQRQKVLPLIRWRDTATAAASER